MTIIKLENGIVKSVVKENVKVYGKRKRKELEIKMEKARKFLIPEDSPSYLDKFLSKIISFLEKL